MGKAIQLTRTRSEQILILDITDLASFQKLLNVSLLE